MGADAAEIHAALARVRAAAHREAERPAEERRNRLGAWLETWRDPASPLRAQLTAELPETTGFSAAVVREGLDAALAVWTPSALERWWRDELAAPAPAGHPRHASGFPTTALILAGALPMPTLQGLLAPLLLGSGVVVKTAAHDPCTARCAAESLLALDAGLGACVAVVDFRRDDREAAAALATADCVVASGADETIARLAAQVAPPRRFVGYGHRVSFAVIGPDAQQGAAAEDTARALARDVALWDQLGCLSPVAAFVVGTDPESDVFSEVCDRFANAFAECAGTLPRGRITPEAAALWTHEADEAELRAAAGGALRVHRAPDRSWCVVGEDVAPARPSPLHRFLRVHPVADLDALGAALSPWAPRLAAVGAAGFDPRTRDLLAARAARLGASRICDLGRMQAPPLGWCHDGLGGLAALARLTDLER